MTAMTRRSRVQGRHAVSPSRDRGMPLHTNCRENLKLPITSTGAAFEAILPCEARWYLCLNVVMPGDIIYSATPENVGPVVKGDVIECHIDKLPNLSVKIV